MNNIITIINNSSIIFAVLAFGALSGLISERAGIVNIAIEGMMTMGALVFSVLSYFIGPTLGNWSQLLLIFAAGLCVSIFSLLHAFACITLKTDQIISGVAINIIAGAFALFVIQIPPFNGKISLVNVFSLLKIYNNFFNIYLFLVIVFLFLLWFMLKKTKWGLHHDAVGENPYAAKAVGINVNKKRYAAVILSGFLAGLAGGIFTFQNNENFFGTVNGKGFIALAIVVFGQWKILPVALGAALFAFFETTSVHIIYFPNISQWFIDNNELLNILPFVSSLLILMITSLTNTGRAPQSLGVPFYNNKT